MEIGTTVCIYFFLQNHKILVLCSEVISYISNDWKRRCKKPKDKINWASISVKFHFGLKLNLRSALKNPTYCSWKAAVNLAYSEKLFLSHLFWI